MSQRGGPPGGYGIDLPTGVLPPPEDRGRVTDPVAVVSFSLGSSTLVLGLCCFPISGLVLGIAGASIGIVSLVRIASHPNRYSGRGLAVAGIVVSIVAPLAYVVAFYALTR